MMFVFTSVGITFYKRTATILYQSKRCNQKFPLSSSQHTCLERILVDVNTTIDVANSTSLRGPLHILVTNLYQFNKPHFLTCRNYQLFLFSILYNGVSKVYVLFPFMSTLSTFFGLSC